MKGIEMSLPRAKDLFSTQEERDDAAREKVLEIPLADLDGFPDHPFQVNADEAMEAMADSVRAVGIQTPAIVRQKDDGRYEIVSGHRRKLACELAGLNSLPCIVRQMSRDEAIIAMVDANLQREAILPSEKARSYKMRLDAMKRQGQRTDLTSVENQQKLKGVTSRQQLSEKTGDSQDKIRNFVRLNELIPEVLTLVDEGKIGISPAVSISYLSTGQQQELLAAIESEDCTPSPPQAAKMRRFSENGQLSADVILSIMQEPKPNQAEQFKIPKDRISRFFKQGTPVEKVQDTIVKALEFYQRHLERGGGGRDTRDERDERA